MQENQKNWVGNGNSIYKNIGASSHTEEVRESNDYYATEPKAVKLLLELENFSDVLEPACGEGHISRELKRHRIMVKSCDKVNRGYGKVFNFF